MKEQRNKKLVMIIDDKRDFKKADNYFCGKSYVEHDIRVRDDIM